MNLNPRVEGSNHSPAKSNNPYLLLSSLNPGVNRYLPIAGEVIRAGSSGRTLTLMRVPWKKHNYLFIERWLVGGRVKDKTWEMKKQN